MINQSINTDYKYTYKHKRNIWREFVIEMWFKHKDEIFLWTGKPPSGYDFDEYFRKNKWFLKNKFKTEELHHD